MREGVVDCLAGGGIFMGQARFMCGPRMCAIVWCEMRSAQHSSLLQDTCAAVADCYGETGHLN